MNFWFSFRIYSDGICCKRRVTNSIPTNATSIIWIFSLIYKRKMQFHCYIIMLKSHPFDKMLCGVKSYHKSNCILTQWILFQAVSITMYTTTPNYHIHFIILSDTFWCFHNLNLKWVLLIFYSKLKCTLDYKIDLNENVFSEKTHQNLLIMYCVSFFMKIDV